jgi:N-acyl homoserine lactone hydrolase
MVRTTVKRLYILDGGYLEVDQTRVQLETRVKERWLKTPSPMYLIQTESENILYDTGCDPSVIEDPEGTWGSFAKVFVPRLTQEDHPINRLNEIGLKPEDITHVVLSHLHFDHSGGIRYFPNAKFIVQMEEYRFALNPNRLNKGGYRKYEFDYPDFHWELIEGDKVLSPGVTLILTHGHSPGHQSLIVDLPSGKTVIIGADAVDLQENIDRELVTPGGWDPNLAYQSIRRLKVIAERNEGWLIPNHDWDVWKTLKKAPEWYE